MKNFLTIPAAMVVASGLAAQAPARTAPPTLITNATVLTVTNGTLTDTDVLLQGGKIAAIGKNLTAPAGAVTIDATGEYLMPGIIDPHSHMMADAINEGTLSVTSMARISDVLNPTDRNIYFDLAGGTTTLNILHGSANAIGGQNAVVKLKWGRPAAEMLFPGAPPGIKFALGENVTRKNSRQFFIPGQGVSPQRYPTTRMGQEEVIRAAFVRALDYKHEWDDYNARKARGEQNLVAPRRDLQLEPLVEVLNGTRFVHAHSYRADEMLMLLDIAKEFHFRIRTLQHALEAYKIAPEIAASGTGISTFADMWGYKIEAYDAIPYNIAITMNAGVLSTINSDDDGRSRRLNIDAAKLQRYGGLTDDQALATITINGAKQLGIDKRVGSIEVGKDADVVIWNGHPLSVYSHPVRTFIDGQVYFSIEHDQEIRKALAAERKELEAAPENQLPKKSGSNRKSGGEDAPSTGNSTQEAGR